MRSSIAVLAAAALGLLLAPILAPDVAVAKKFGKGHGHVTGSVHRGASAFAPGHVKKRLGLRSARAVAPGRSGRLPPGHRAR